MPATPKGRATKYEDPSRQQYWHWKDIFLGIDMFGVRPTMEVKGKRKFKSCCGATVSFFGIIIILIYALFCYVDTQINTSDGKKLLIDLVGKDRNSVQQYANYRLYTDAGARLGGFIFFIHFVLSAMVKCLNRKLYIKHVLTETYLLQKNEDYLCVPAGYLSKHDRKQGKGGQDKSNGSLRKPKSTAGETSERSKSAPGTSRTSNLERIPEEDGEDKSNYESLREGGGGSGSSLNQSNRLQIQESSSESSSEDDDDNTIKQDIGENNYDEEMFDFVQLQSKMTPPIMTQRNKLDPSERLVTTEKPKMKNRNHSCSDDEKWDDDDDDKNSQIFEGMKEMSVYLESEDSVELENRLQRQQMEFRDYGSFSPMIEAKNKQFDQMDQQMEGGSARNGGRSGRQYQKPIDSGSQRSGHSAMSPRSHRSGNKGMPDYASQRSGVSKQSATQSKRSNAPSIKSENSQGSKFGGTSSRGSATKRPKIYAGKPRSDFVKININDWQVFRLQCTPVCCRSRYQKSLARMFQKGTNKLHRELEVGYLLKSIREAKYPVRSYANTNVFNPPDLIQEYQTHYVNTLQISLNTQDSIREEQQEPIPVDYVQPNPTCVCPDLGEENMFKITNAALETLKHEQQIMAMVDDQSKKKKASHEGGNSDKRSKRSLMNSSGKKINTEDLVDKSSRKGKNDPIQIIQPVKEPSEKPKSEQKINKDKQKDDDKASSRKSSISPIVAGGKDKDKDKDKDKKKKDKDKKEKKDKDKDKKDKKDKKDDKKDKKRRSTIKKEESGAENTDAAKAGSPENDKTVEIMPN